MWGLGYRFSMSDSHGGLSISLNPADSDTHLFSSFVQDEITIVPKKLTLTVGTKLERDTYSGFTLMPSGERATRSAPAVPCGLPCRERRGPRRKRMRPCALISLDLLDPEAFPHWPPNWKSVW